MEHECIDILMATYNGEKYLREQIDSILNQTYKNFNLIISDDCSKDDTVKILKEYEKKDSRITLYCQKNNLGYRKNFEFLCKNSKADYVMLADQDDVWNLEKVELLFNYIQKNNYILVFSDLEIVDSNLKTINKSMIRYMGKKKQCKYNDYRAVNLDNVVTGCATIFKKEVLEKAIPFPTEVYPHDWWLALIATELGKISFYDKPLVKYRQHETNTIGIKSQMKERIDFYVYRKELIDFHKKQFNVCNNRIKLFDKYKKIIINGNEYFKRIDKNKHNLFKNIKMFMIIHNGIKLSRKLKHFTMYHFPRIGKFLFDKRSELNEKTAD